MKKSNRNTKSMKLQPYIVAIALVISFTLYFSFLSISRHVNYYSLRLDLGNMDQTVWNVIHGNGFVLTDAMTPIQKSRLAGHADLLLILISPLYIVWSNPIVLLLIQSFIVGIGGYVIYLIAKYITKDSKISVLFVFIYVLYPPLQKVTLQDFHAEALSTTFFLISFYALLRKKPIVFYLFAILAGLGKEQDWLVVVLLGLFALIKTKHKTFAVLTCITGVIAFIYLFWHAIPQATVGGQHWALSYLSKYGSNLNSIVVGVFSHPMNVIEDMLSTDRIFYYVQLFFPVGFLSIFAPIYLIFALPNIVINVLSNNPLMRMIDYQYTSSITPWIFVSFIYGFENIQKRIPIYVRKKYLVGFIIISGLISSYVWGELPFGKTSRFSYFLTDQSENVLLRKLEESISSKYSVSATNNVGSHFSQREFIYYFPVNALKADYVIAKLGDQYAWPSGDEQFATVTKLLHSNEYELFDQLGNLYVFKRKTL